MKKDKDNFTISKGEYNNFRDKLSNQIKNASISLDAEDCYLITETYDNKLVEYLDKKEKNDNNNFLNDNPDIIKNLSEIIEHLNKNKSIKLISKKLIESIYDKNNFKDEHAINYYAGNNKIIIEYKNNIDNKSLLMIYSNEEKKDDIKKNIFILSFDNQNKKEFFNKILSSENNFDEKNENIIPFDKFINNNQEHNNKFINYSQIGKQNKSRANSQSFLKPKKNNSIDNDIPKCNKSKRKSTIKNNRVKNLCLENNYFENKDKAQSKIEQLNLNISNCNTSNPKDEKENINKYSESNNNNKLIENLNLKEKKNNELKNDKNICEIVEDKQHQENQDENDSNKLNNIKEGDNLNENHNEFNKKNLEIVDEIILEYQNSKKTFHCFSDGLKLKMDNSYFSIINNKIKVELKEQKSSLEIIKNNKEKDVECEKILKEKENLNKELELKNKNIFEENQNLKKENKEYKCKQKELQDNIKKLEDKLTSLKNKINDLERINKDKDDKILELNKNLNKEKDNQKYIDKLKKENEELSKKIIEIKDYKIKENNELKEKITTLKNNNEIQSKELND